VAATLGPAMAAMKGIQGGLSSMMPQADQSFGQISDLIGGIMTVAVKYLLVKWISVRGNRINEE
jgi:hypothetical protein